MRSAIIHVVADDDSSYFSLALALITLSPILLMVSPAYRAKYQLLSVIQASYAALAVQTREFLVIVMWAGQLFGELLNWVIKRAIKQDRPIRAAFTAIQGFILKIFFPEHIGNGYGFPSSHSQYMAYFASFLMCHLYFRHRFSSTGYSFLDFLWRMTVYAALLGWSGLVAYSRRVLKSSFMGDGPDNSTDITLDIITFTRYPGDSRSVLDWEFSFTS